VPERHGKHAGHAEDQREGEEVPLFPEEIDICIAKEFHKKPGFKVAEFQGFKAKTIRP
jgi:hypothetical protein